MLHAPVSREIEYSRFYVIAHREVAVGAYQLVIFGQRARYDLPGRRYDAGAADQGHAIILPSGLRARA